MDEVKWREVSKRKRKFPKFPKKSKFPNLQNIGERVLGGLNQADHSKKAQVKCLLFPYENFFCWRSRFKKMYQEDAHEEEEKSMNTNFHISYFFRHVVVMISFGFNVKVNA